MSPKGNSVKSTNRKTVQISLIFLGLMLIAITYFVYPKLTQKISEKIDDEQTGSDETISDTSFTDVEYKGLTNDGNPYTVLSEIATTDPNNSDIVFLEFVKVTFYYNDGRVVVITSNKGRFNKINGDLNFKENVKMIDSDNNRLTSENLDMLMSENYAAAYNNAKLLTIDGQFILADKIMFDSTKKIFKISMLEKDKKIKAKLIK